MPFLMYAICLNVSFYEYHCAKNLPLQVMPFLMYAICLNVSFYEYHCAKNLPLQVMPFLMYAICLNVSFYEYHCAKNLPLQVMPFLMYAICLNVSFYEYHCAKNVSKVEPQLSEGQLICSFSAALSVLLLGIGQCDYFTGSSVAICNIFTTAYNIEG